MCELLSAKDLMELLGIKSGRAYGLIRQINSEMESKGYITITGKVNKQFLYERMGFK